ncbi:MULTISPECIES: type II toxin-antitoxin system RelE/ParE family toxin [unclassified Nostoc]|uniref:type II toxin-antitoxin system RelE/ParE family toxin n=1 Tax=unclassified Nostoc TaxID=2593658 RepID=UPI002AD213E4|nr:type II toxin-antitoxin system RelE/ParE family toxin [Nostoc sp. DedQUE03]MDZ7975593.1 type II toxin-antitoxin system RelE/ParE family toxin [Nostoc sp. DedQUE03]MDZ8045445.1 type II toxin-antitoxin system RelE/ParE family toxin [Nostoc sp. DedQUE02]
MIIYKTRWFDRWARKEGLNDLSLCTAVNEMTAGLYEADLGGGLFKKRIARSGQGKRGGFRTLVATNKGDCWFFVFGFLKNERSNINKKEEKALKKLASVLFSYTLEDLEKAKLEDELMEVICNAEEEISDS